MPQFSRLIRFQAVEDGAGYFADLGSGVLELPRAGALLKGYATIKDLQAVSEGKEMTISKLLAPVPNESLPIYCAGLNYRSHAAEIGMSPSKNPPLWTKPAACLANPEEEIPINEFCAASMPDYEGELVFIVSKTCKDLSISQAQSNILGYTVGHDISCRTFQQPDQVAGQAFFAKGFDKFGPIGPVLISPAELESQKSQNKGSVRLTTKVNGVTLQDCDCFEDLIFPPARILSFMSQGTTIPGGTAVMTGTPAGVGWTRKPQTSLKDGDVTEVEIEGIGVLRNTIRFV